MRRHFVETLVALAEHDQRIMFLTGDLGFSVVEPFAEQYPDRFVNVGVAEQDMIGIATGLAEAGFIPFVYSIATFASLRAYEFIRNGPVLHGLPVRVVGVGGGFEYGTAGPTHHAVEDIGVMRLQSGLMVVVPADFEQATAALHATWDHPGPVYYRLGKNETDTVPGLHGKYGDEGVDEVRCGVDLAIVATGPIAIDAVAAAEKLAENGVQAAVYVASCLNPAPRASLARALSRVPVAISVEVHSVDGGLGSLLCEVVAEEGLVCRVRRCGVSGRASRGGSETYHLQVHGLTAVGIASVAREALSVEALVGGH